MDTSQVALITGVSREMGLGFETARQLAQQGYEVILTARQLPQAEDLAAHLREQGFAARALALDVLSDESVKEVAAQVERLDVLINNAALAIYQEAPAATVDLASVQAQFEANFLAPWRVVQALLPQLRRSAHGRIVNVSSSVGSFTSPGSGFSADQPQVLTYALTKLALNGLTIKLAKELATDHIQVNAACPGFTATRPGLAEYGARPVAEGAASIVGVATLPADGPTGGFFRDGQLLDW